MYYGGNVYGTTPFPGPTKRRSIDSDFSVDGDSHRGDMAGRFVVVGMERRFPHLCPNEFGDGVAAD